MAEIVRFEGSDRSFMLVETSLARPTDGDDIEVIVKPTDGGAAAVTTRLEDWLSSYCWWQARASR
jgi:hypothetical protein